jgi:hypothetical protein
MPFDGVVVVHAGAGFHDKQKHDLLKTLMKEVCFG